MPVRSCSVSSRLINAYHPLLMAMCVLQHEAVQGKPIEGSCHSIVRAVAQEFPEFKVVDGVIPRLAPLPRGALFGREGFFRFKEGLVGFWGRLNFLHHAWLVWKHNEKFIIDVCPIGGVYAPPVILYQDEYALSYEPGKLPEGLKEEDLLPCVDQFHDRLKRVLDELSLQAGV